MELNLLMLILNAKREFSQVAVNFVPSRLRERISGCMDLLWKRAIWLPTG